jgi:hypothetical protein
LDCKKPQEKSETAKTNNPTEANKGISATAANGVKYTAVVPGVSVVNAKSIENSKVISVNKEEDGEFSAIYIRGRFSGIGKHGAEDYKCIAVTDLADAWVCDSYSDRSSGEVNPIEQEGIKDLETLYNLLTDGAYKRTVGLILERAIALSQE